MRRIHPEATVDLFLAVTKPGNRRMMSLGVAARRRRRTSTSCPAAGHPRRGRALRRMTIAPSFSSCWSTRWHGHLRRARARRGRRCGARGQRRRGRRRLDRSAAALAAPARGALARRAERRASARPLRRAVAAARAPASGARARRRRSTGWTGPSAASHDFQLGRGAVEVKCTAGKQHQVLRIAASGSSTTPACGRSSSSTSRSTCGRAMARRWSTRSPPCARRWRHRRGRRFRGAPAPVRIRRAPTSPAIAARLHRARGELLPRRGGFPRIVEADLPPGSATSATRWRSPSASTGASPLAEVRRPLGGGPSERARRARGVRGEPPSGRDRHRRGRGRGGACSEVFTRRCSRRSRRPARSRRARPATTATAASR